MVQAEVSGIGLVLAAISMIGNGTFGIFGKLCKKEPDPILFNVFLALGIMISSLLTIPFFPLVTPDGSFPLEWTWFGAMSGVLVVVATAASFVAISLAGLATAQATWSCAAILVAFLWGALGPQRGGKGPGAPVGNWGITILSVVLLVLGVVVINLAGQLATMFFGKEASKDNVAAETSGDMESATDITSSEAPSEDGGKSSLKTILGLIPALVVGISGGSILVPNSFVQEELEGLLALPSSGVAAGFLGLVVFLVYWTVIKRSSLSLRKGSELSEELNCGVIVYGIISGFFWNMGNICQIIAITYVHMPYGVSYPILQCALIVAGLWGIFVFKEVTRCTQVLFFFVGVAILLTGVVLLGLFGPGSG